MSRRPIILTIAFAISALGTALVILYVQGIDARATAGQEMVEVLTATETIKPGESVADAQSAGKLERTSIVRDDVVEGALASTASIDDEIALDTIYPGEQVIEQNFGKSNDLEGLPIPAGYMAISVELTDPARVAGFVVPGSEVAIFVSGEPELYKPDGTTQKLPAYTRLILPKVQVVGVGATSMSSRTTSTKGTETVEQIPRTILTIAVDQTDAEKVLYAARNGELAFALRTDRSEAVSRPGVTGSDIMPEIFRTQP